MKLKFMRPMAMKNYSEITRSLIMSDIKEHYLLPGEIFASGEPSIITTVLGSCVSICLWDPYLRLGGINHFLLPLWNGEGLASPRYGNVAFERLLDKMTHLGSRIEDMKAKVFGGSSVLQVVSQRMNVGERNIELAAQMLGEYRIDVVSSDVGGNTGRKVKFNSESGIVLVKKLQKRIFVDLYSRHS